MFTGAGWFGVVLVSFVTDAQSWLMSELLLLAPGSQNGGIYANKSGYHNTRNNHLANRPNDYSIRDAVDRLGPGDKAAALDWTFPDAQSGRYGTISAFMSRIIASGKDQGDDRLNGWREFYGQADGDLQVEGWDSRYLVPVSSDSSHLWHIHMSESREFVESFGNKRALLSVLRGETVDEWECEDMATAEEIARAVVAELAYSNKAWGANAIADDGVNAQSNQNRWAVAADEAAKANAGVGKVLERLELGGVDPAVLARVVDAAVVRALKAYAKGGLDALD